LAGSAPLATGFDDRDEHSDKFFGVWVSPFIDVGQLLGLVDLV